MWSCVPLAHHACFRENLKVLHGRLGKEKLPLLIFVNKGIEMGTNALTLEIIADTCGQDISRAATFIVIKKNTLHAGLTTHTYIPSISQVLRLQKKVRDYDTRC